MTRWTQGEAEVERLLGEGNLQRVQGAQADGRPLLAKAESRLRSAAVVASDDSDAAFALSYDAARFPGTSLLAQQGLRPTTRGGHLAVENAVRAQFGGHFHEFRDLRVRRNEIEYPAYPDESVTADEANDATASASRMVHAAQQLIEHLTFF